MPEDTSATVRHVILLAFNEGTEDSLIVKLMEAYKDLRSQVGGITHIDCGRDMSAQGLHQGFTHCFLASFTDAAARDAYVEHQTRIDYMETLLPEVDKIIVLDFEPYA